MLNDILNVWKFILTVISLKHRNNYKPSSASGRAAASLSVSAFSRRIEYALLIFARVSCNIHIQIDNDNSHHSHCQSTIQCCNQQFTANLIDDSHGLIQLDIQVVSCLAGVNRIITLTVFIFLQTVANSVHHPTRLHSTVGLRRVRQCELDIKHLMPDMLDFSSVHD